MAAKPYHLMSDSERRVLRIRQNKEIAERTAPVARMQQAIQQDKMVRRAGKLMEEFIDSIPTKEMQLDFINVMLTKRWR